MGRQETSRQGGSAKISILTEPDCRRVPNGLEQEASNQKMADVEKTVLIGYSAEQMYDLVTKVADYPDFLPWCGGVEIFEQTEALLDAKIHIRYKGLHQYFHTRNTQHRPRQIDMAFADGPFKRFHGSWHFIALRADACKVEFRLHYEFSSVLLDKLIGPVFSMIANTFVDGFVKRAEVVYGSAA